MVKINPFWTVYSETKEDVLRLGLNFDHGSEMFSNEKRFNDRILVADYNEKESKISINWLIAYTSRKKMLASSDPRA